MDHVSIDDLAAVMAVEGMTPVGALGELMSRSGVGWGSAAPEAAAVWLRGLLDQLPGLADKSRNADAWPWIAGLREAASDRLAQLLGDDRLFMDGADLLQQLGLRGDAGFGRWARDRANGAQDYTSAIVLAPYVSQSSAEGSVMLEEEHGGTGPFLVIFPALESRLVREIERTAVECVASYRAAELMRRIESPDEWDETPDASWIRNAGDPWWGSDSDDLLVLLEIAEGLGIDPPAGLTASGGVDLALMAELEDRLIAALGLPEAAADPVHGTRNTGRD